MTWNPDICIYHANCNDGFAAAFAVYRRWSSIPKFVSASYGDNPPDVKGKRVLIVDFSYKRPAIEQMAADAASIVILDHHASAARELSGLEHIIGGSSFDVERILAHVKDRPLGNVLVDFDMEHSGAYLAWRFCFPATKVPDLIRYVEDRDLWKFELEESRSINAALASYPQDFKEWEDLMECWLFGIPDNIVNQGRAILRQREKDLGALLDATLRKMTIGGVTVPTANVPFFLASDAGNILAEGNPFAATYFDRGDGTRAFSLRSHRDGADVSEIAQQYGGGGHKHAAGFSMPIGWEGDL